MNRQEALEWATDYLDRAKVFDGASLTPVAKLEIISNFADTVVTPDPPKVKQFVDQECANFIQACAAKMKTSRESAYRNILKQAIDQHCWYMAGQSPANAPHPDHTVPGDPTEDADEPEPATTTRRASKSY